ncbi:hypothetical protein MMC14_000238 [Varicellaria rhodocarpa]|nr:hypothetical protein [Varicellaria rhodocarpa]
MLALFLLATLLPSLALSFPSSLTTFGCCDCPRNVPENFTISDFNLFLASSGSTPGNSFLSFSFLDPQNDVSTSCSREVTAAQATTGQSIDDANEYFECANTNVSFLFSRAVFSIVEKFLCNGQTLLYTRTATSNNTNFQSGLECFPSEAGTPLGAGTQCQIPGDDDTDVVPVTYVSPE